MRGNSSNSKYQINVNLQDFANVYYKEIPITTLKGNVMARDSGR